MNCREALLHLYEYLDKELTEDTVRKIEGHLTICEHCFDKYEFEKMLHKAIAEKGRAVVNAEPLKAKVLEQIAEIDRDDRSGGFFSRFRPYLAAAAAMAVIVLSLISGLGRKDSEVYAGLRPFVSSHLENVVGVDKLLVNESSTEIEATIGNAVTIPAAFLEPNADRHPTRVFLVTCSGSEAAHFVYEYTESDLSVYIISDSTFQPCPNLSVVREGHHTYHCGSLDGINVLIWRCEAAWCVAVADTGVENLMAFASAY